MKKYCSLLRLILSFQVVFNGTIPGPVIAVDQGERLQITLKNEGHLIVLNCMLQMGQVDKLVEVNSIDHQDLGLQGREVKMFFESVYTAFPDFHTTTIDRMDMENAFSIYKNENYV